MRRWLIVCGLVFTAACPSTSAPIPPLKPGEWRESTSGPGSLAEPNPTNALRALVQAAQGGPFECLASLVAPTCYADSGDWYGLESCRAGGGADTLCDVLFDGDVVGALTLHQPSTQTWTAYGDFAGREVQLLRNGDGAIAVVTWMAAEQRAERAYADPVSAECRSKVQRVSVEYLPQAALRTKCGVSVAIGGCSFTASGRTYIEDVLDDDELTHAHEYLHHLLRCETGTSDTNHRDNAWRRL